MQVLVPAARERLRVRGVTSTVFSRPLPLGSVVRLRSGVQLVCPELLFVELGTLMRPEVQLLAGLELCGRFSRDPLDPRDGDVTYDIAPVTSADAIRAYVAQAHHVPGLTQSAHVAQLLVDNAWSPTEAVIAALCVLPLFELGYGMPGIQLNVRLTAPREQRRLASKASRVPDLLFEGTRVGINYDGDVHFSLEEIARAAREGTDAQVGRAVATARAALVGDKRRDRDLMVQGLVVLPATREDLTEEGGLDRLMGQVFSLIEQTGGPDVSSQVRALRSVPVARERQRLIWSLLSGERGRRLSHDLAHPAPMPEPTWYEEDIVF